MRVIASIEDPDVIRKILKHLDLWEVKARPPPKTNICPAPEDLPTEAFIISDAQEMLSSHDYDDPPSSLYFGETRPSTPMKLRRDKLPGRSGISGIKPAVKVDL